MTAAPARLVFIFCPPTFANLTKSSCRYRGWGQVERMGQIVMASNSSRSILSQPSLWDRLAVAPVSENQDTLLRDLSFLLNTTALSASRDLSRWPRVSRSVLNYGIAGFTGRMLTNADIPQVQRVITRAIQQFEPRLDPKSVQVAVLTGQPGQSVHQWSVRIQAQRRDIAIHASAAIECWAVIDAESGQLSMSE